MAGLTIQPGMRICNKLASPKDDPRNGLGSIGGFVKGPDKANYIVTCYHCVYNANMDWLNFRQDDTNCRVLTQAFGDFHEFGTIVAAMRNNEADVALIRIDDGIDIVTDIPGIKKLQPMRVLTQADGRKVTVRQYGGVSQLQHGQFEAIANDISCPYKMDHDKTNTFDHLIKITGLDGDFSVEGDSGSLIVDEQAALVGMIVIGVGNTSYGIPADMIKKNLPITI